MLEETKRAKLYSFIYDFFIVGKLYIHFISFLLPLPTICFGNVAKSFINQLV